MSAAVRSPIAEPAERYEAVNSNGVISADDGNYLEEWDREYIPQPPPHSPPPLPPTPRICLFAIEMLNFSLRYSHSDEEPSSDDDDDALSEILSTISLSESIMDYVYENGRRYHSYPHALYAFPNDEQEQDRLDLMHHLWNLALGGELFLAPIEHSKIKRVCAILSQEAIDRFRGVQNHTSLEG